MLDVLYLFSLLILVLLGFYVFVADPRSRAHQTFAAFISFCAIWTTKDLIFWGFLNNRFFAEIWAASGFIIAILMQCALVVFAWVFPVNSRTPKQKAAALFAPGLIFIIVSALGLCWNEISFENGKLSIKLTGLAYAVVAYIYCLFLYGAVLLFRKYRLYRDTQRASQLAAILLGLTLTAFLKSFVNIFLPFFGNYSLLPYSSLFFLPGVTIYAYAISNFKLFSLQSALDQFRLFPVTYKVALSVAMVAIFSFALFQIPIVWWAFSEGVSVEAWRRYLVFSIVSALLPNLFLVLLIVRSISRPLQRIAVAAVQVSEGKYGTQIEMRKSNDEIGLVAETFNAMSKKMAADIERLKSLNERLIRAEKLAAMGTLAAGVAHEVNNPLALISSIVQMLKSSSASNPENLEKLELIQKQIERISRVTRDLTDFARIRPQLRIETNLNRIVESSARLAALDEKFQKLDLTLDLDPKIPLTSVDPGQLEQVVLNLLLNAKDSLEAGGKITLKTFSEENYSCIEVSDEGIGIPENDLPRIFEPFFTTKSPGNGTGLGLSVCYAIVAAHSGRIDVESVPGKGSRFIVRIPALSQNQDSGSVP
ncbi:MAG TPA: ATP-binding protein [Pyrinomonadaceae bacterium]|nr:ATP-binding protein [Pyrinomonadaceae bacterium]